jgi:hypothetical protein
MKKNKPFLTYWIIALILVWLLSCTKGTIGERQYTFDRYELKIDWYTLDTTFIKTAYTQVFDSIYKPETRLAFETASDQWYIDCNMLEVLQHLYYTKNGKKIKN